MRWRPSSCESISDWIIAYFTDSSLYFIITYSPVDRNALEAAVSEGRSQRSGSLTSGKPTSVCITAAQLATAKGSELQYWIEQANADAQKKVLKKSGRVDELRQRLAQYYGINLSPSAEDSTTVVKSSDTTSQPVFTIDKEIRMKQWAAVRELGEQWRTRISKNEPFYLLPQSEASASVRNGQ